jgi:undecaprenyl-diphosphatase
MDTSPTPAIRREALPLIGFAAASAATLAVVHVGGAAAIDRRVLIALRTPGDLADPVGPRWFEDVMVNLTSLGSNAVLTLLTLLVVGYLLATARRGVAMLVATAAAGGALLSWSLKGAFDRARPDVVAHLVDVHSTSFPSGHSTGAAATYLMLGILLARVAPRRSVKLYVLGAALLLTTIVGGTRVYLGVHWPTDVLAGWVVGTGWALLCWCAAAALQRRGAVERRVT